MATCGDVEGHRSATYSGRTVSSSPNRRRATFASGLALASAVAFLGGCGGKGGTGILRVPADYATIQAAVDASRSGDMVLIAPGTYTEAVKVSTDGITVRGEDRNTVVLDGGDTLANGFYVGADNVAIENLTVHNFTQNGVVFNGIDAATDGKGPDPDTPYGTDGHSLAGYAARYITSYNNGLYGIYAFAASDGIIENSYVSGHPDSGIYVGQCNPCRVVVRRVTAELNAIGYYGTNASGDVWVIESTFSHNRLGITPNSQQMEKLSPQLGATVAGNLVTDNDDSAAPAIPKGFFGGGIAIGGGGSNVVVRNRIEGHEYAGIILTNMNDFLPRDNRVEGNVLKGNAVDLLWRPEGAASADGNCFAGNSFGTSSPADIEVKMPCEGRASVTAADLGRPPNVVVPPDVDYRTIDAPPPQQSMPASQVQELPALIAFTRPLLASIEVPSR